MINSLISEILSLLVFKKRKQHEYYGVRSRIKFTMNSSIRQSIDSELFFIIKYHIYAFFYYMRIFPEQCFYFDDYMRDSNNNNIPLPTMYSTFIVDDKNSIQEWFSKLENLIKKKKLLKLMINCHNPGIKLPIKQLVIDFYDNDKQVFFNKDSKKSAMNEIKKHKIAYLSKLLQNYRSIKNKECFYDIEDAAINMKFVYKNRSEVNSNNDNTQSFIKQNYTDLKYKYMDYRIFSKINTFENQKEKREEQSVIKKRNIICSTELVKKDNNNDYVYSEIEESDLEEAVCNESPTKVDNSSNLFLNF